MLKTFEKYLHFDHNSNDFILFPNLIIDSVNLIDKDNILRIIKIPVYDYTYNGTLDITIKFLVRRSEAKSWFKLKGDANLFNIDIIDLSSLTDYLYEYIEKQLDQIKQDNSCFLTENDFKTIFQKRINNTLIKRLILEESLYYNYIEEKWIFDREKASDPRTLITSRFPLD